MMMVCVLKKSLAATAGLAMALAMGAAAGCGDDAAASDAGVRCAQAALCGAADGGPLGADAATPAQERAPSVLTSTAELMASSAAAVQRLDARGAAEYRAGHLPGAVHLDAARLRVVREQVAGQVPAPEVVFAAFADAGLDPERPVVVYEQGNGLAAARTVWALRYHGHAESSLLEQGLGGWSGELSQEPQAVQASDYPERELVETLRVDADYVLAHLDDPNVVFVDARASTEFAAAHIPGALNFDWTDNLQGGAMKSVEALGAMYAEIPREATVVVYCQTGTRASMGWLALVHAGYADVRLYDGSMAEWTQDPARPTEP